MPIKTKDLGKYRRPGIFIEENDQSIISLPIQNVLRNLVPGFSKKGPINNPILITNTDDFTTKFGEIDRSLENKGSYFHRTCIKMLETGPIYAINLLKTEDDRDKIQWVSVSSASKYNNYGLDSEKNIPYSKIFNRQDFWEKDEVTFIDYLKSLDSDWSDNRLLQLTNVGGKNITVFIFKSSTPGFDITASDWYGGDSKVPAYLSPTDWMSDYLVDVLVIEGDWTNYNYLSVDPVWGTYFNTDGLIKSQIQGFVNQNNVTVLANYDVSLIPYFKDSEGRDMYIRTIINNDSDRTGLFCTYNEDMILQSDYRTDKMDIIGYGLVDSAVQSIDFLSYRQSIVENLTFAKQMLDSEGNVFGNYGYDLTVAANGTYASRTTSQYTNWYVHKVCTGSTTSSAEYVIGITGATNEILLTSSGSGPTGQIYFNKSFGSVGVSNNYLATPTTGGFTITDMSGNAITGLTLGTVINVIAIQSFATFEVRSDAYFVVDTKQTITTGLTTKVYFQPLSGVITNSSITYRTDVVYLTKGNTNILTQDSNSFIDSSSKIVLGTALVTFSAMTMSVDYTPVTVGGDQSGSRDGYITLDSRLLNITEPTSTTLVLDFNAATGTTTYELSRRTKIFDEITTNLQAGATQGKMVIIDVASGGTKYTIGTNYSIFGNIITIVGLDNSAKYHLGGQGVIFNYVDNEFMMSPTTSTSRMLTTNQPYESLSLSGITASSAAGVMGKFSLLYQNYYNGQINNGDYFYQDNNQALGIQIFLNMYIDTIGNLVANFVSTPGSLTPQPVTNWGSSSTYNYQLIVTSQKGNLKQTVELENNTQYTDLTNVRSIWVDKTRYSGLKKGLFLEAYYDENALEVGQTPKTLVRIIKVVQDPNNADWNILSADGPIKVTTDGSEYQTMSYTQIDSYVVELKGMKIKPFKMSVDSIPNGTDQRQSDILSVIDKSTNLAKALANKNKIQWRYLVDSFGLGLNSSVYPGGSKQQLADVCGMKKNCFGFLNMPSLRDFKNSSNPSFVNDDGTVNTYYIMQGGNEDKNPSYTYEFAQKSSDGKFTYPSPSCVGYFFTYVRIDDNGIPKWFPPASYVATSYMQKFLGGSQPWTIVAGVDAGQVVGIGGVEMDFNDDDLENLYQMGANPIVRTPSGIYYINSENTAQVFPYSSLSVIHAREVLIELENSIYDMLLGYHWKYNTPENRSEIKYKADKICKDLLDANALYDYNNVCDETNNTNYIIDLQMGVLDTYIEIIKGMGTIINNITILKKGSIQSGGFA